MAMPPCCYLAKGAKRPSHTTNTIKVDRIPFDPCNSIKKFDLCPFDQKNSTYLQPPKKCVVKYGVYTLALTDAKTIFNYDRFAISVPARSLLLFHVTSQYGNISGPKGPGALEEKRTYPVHVLYLISIPNWDSSSTMRHLVRGSGRFGKNTATVVSAKKYAETS